MIKKISTATINIGLILIFLTVSSCTVSKQKGDVGGLKRAYHNITSEYNGYFNANELIIKGKETLNKSVPNDYSEILPVFPYMESTSASSVYPDMDLVVEKMSRIASLHSDGFWVDDAYLLVGISQFLKQDYETAETSLLYFQQEFEQGSQKKNAKLSRQQKARIREVQSKERAKVAKEKAEERKEIAKEREKTRKELQKERQKAIKQRQKDAKKGRKTKSTVKQDVAPAPKNEVINVNEATPTIDKKSEEKVENEKKPSTKYEGKFKHRIVYDEGLLWLARTYIKRKQPLTAQRLLNGLDADPDMDTPTKKEIVKTFAYFHIDQKTYVKAIPYVQKAIELEKDKNEKARLTFILAQLYERSNGHSEAKNAYAQVVEYKPDYELMFSAKVNEIISGLQSSGYQKEEALANLENLTNDGKNEEYQDRIYYYMGKVELDQNNIPAATNHFKTSVKSSSNTNIYKTLSYNTLGDLAYDSEDFLNAKLYYDTTLQLMKTEDLKRKDLEIRRNQIKEVADNLQIIQLQDSLIRISKMTPEEQEAIALEIRNKMIQEKLDQQKKAEKSARPASGSNQRTAQGVGFAGGPQMAGSVTSSFFAYDDKNLKKGVRDFESKWGSRALQDNWRRSQRSGAEDKSSDGGEFSARQMRKSISQAEVKQILKDVPMTEEQMNASLKKKEDAMFMLGQVYRQNMEDLDKSIVTLETLLQEYPNTSHELKALYLLYLNHNEKKNYQKANFYKDEIYRKYRDSEIATALTEQISGHKTLAERAVEEYDITYKEFSNGNYSTVAEMAKVAEKNYQGTPTQPKFALLGAMSIGNIQGKEPYIAELKRVISEYRGTPEQIKAAEILRLLGQTAQGTPTADQPEVDKSFVAEDDKFHYVMVIWKEGPINFEQVKNTISNFNLKYYRLENLKTSSITLDINLNTQLILIRTFSDAEKALRYFKETQNREAEFVGSTQQGEVFIITQNNYREVLKRREVDTYRGFFMDHYLNR